jgi:hypothetical protein
VTTPAARTVRVEGLDNLLRTLKRARIDISDLKDANAKAGRTVASAAGFRVPRRSGALANTIRAAKQAKRARVVAGKAAVPYAGPIHWGWPARHISSQPFISEAAQATEPIWTADYRAELQSALAKVKGK